MVAQWPHWQASEQAWPFLEGGENNLKYFAFPPLQGATCQLAFVVQCPNSITNPEVTAMNKQEIQAIIDAAIAAGATVTELPAAGKGKGKGKGKDKPVDLSTPIGDDTPADDDMVDGEPEAPAALPPVVPSAATGRSDVQYVIGSKAAVIVERPTLQRGSSKAVGAAWRATAVVGTNIRAVKLALLMELAEPFTHAEALAALAPLKANGTIGSGTPASCIRAFVKAGYLEVA